MANLALAGIAGVHHQGEGRHPRVLDPCFGRGWLLPYASASGVMELVCVDSDSVIWDGAEWDRGGVGGSPLLLAVPTFVIGDVGTVDGGVVHPELGRCYSL
jgi:hypothetical protein